MLQLMRNPRFIKTAMWIVIVSFVAWLGVELGYQGGGPTGSNPEVGVVAGEPIYWIQYRREIAEMRDYQRQQTNVIAEEFDLDEQVWQQNVQRILLRQAIARANITVTADEIADAMVANPPRGFEQVPDFQNPDDSFNADAYRGFLSSMTQERWSQITGMSFYEYESQMRFGLEYQKLEQAVQAGAWATDAELRQSHRDQNEQVTVRAIAAPTSIVDDGDVEITDDDVQRYYETHLAEYRQPARAMIQYVTIPRNPSAQDSVIVRNQAWDLYNQIGNGADFADLARLYSEDESNAGDGGALGTFPRGQMVSEFEESAFATDAGDVAEPVHTRFGWHIIKVERRVTSPEDSVEARHILLRDTEPGVETADSLLALAEDISGAGARFEELAEESGLTPETTQWFDLDVVYPIPQIARPLRRLVRWAFSGEIGGVASPHITDDQIIVAQIEARRPEGPTDLSEVRSQIEMKLLADKKVQRAAELLRPVADKIAQGQSMDAAVQGTDFVVQHIGPFTRSQYVPEVQAGSFDGFIGAAFALGEPGSMSGLVTIPERGAYIMTLVERTYDEAAFEQQADRLQTRLEQRRQQSMFADWNLFLRQNAEIEDDRDLFYRYN